MPPQLRQSRFASAPRAGIAHDYDHRADAERFLSYLRGHGPTFTTSEACRPEDLVISERTLRLIDELVPEATLLDGPALDRYESGLGSYLGELLVSELDGSWHRDEHGWCVVLGDSRVYPYHKARRRLMGGRSESLVYFFRVIKRTVTESRHEVNGRRRG